MTRMISLTRKQKIAQGLPKAEKKGKVRAEKRELQRKYTVCARLNRCMSSTRKMRMVADMVRGKNAQYALAVLKLSPRAAALDMHKLLISALHNWEQKLGPITDYTEIILSKVLVDGGTMLKRLRPAPQGRGYRIRKRSNHVLLVLDSIHGIDWAAREAELQSQAAVNQPTTNDSAE